MQQNTKEEQMQDGGHSGVLWAARRCCHWFAYRFDVCFLPLSAFRFLLKQDSGRFLLIRNVI
jgi:hypothetical protein